MATRLRWFSDKVATAEPSIPGRPAFGGVRSRQASALQVEKCCPVGGTLGTGVAGIAGKGQTGDDINKVTPDLARFYIPSAVGQRGGKHPVTHGVMRCRRQGATCVSRGGFELATKEQRESTTGQDPEAELVYGAEGQCTFEVLLRLRCLPGITQQPSRMIMRAGRTGIQRQRAVQMGKPQQGATLEEAERISSLRKRIANEPSHGHGAPAAFAFKRSIDPHPLRVHQRGDPGAPGVRRSIVRMLGDRAVKRVASAPHRGEIHAAQDVRRPQVLVLCVEVAVPLDTALQFQLS